MNSKEVIERLSYLQNKFGVKPIRVSLNDNGVFTSISFISPFDKNDNIILDSEEDSEADHFYIGLID